jgi:hypothetical protein
MTTETLSAEVEVAVREVITSFREMHARFKAMEAAARDVAYIERRWKLLPGSDEGAVLLLEDLLNSQERLVDEEYAFLRAQVDYSLSMIEWRRAIGTLLQYEELAPMRTTEGCLPRLEVSKQCPHVPYPTPEALPPPEDAEGGIRPLPPPTPDDPGVVGRPSTPIGDDPHAAPTEFGMAR